MSRTARVLTSVSLGYVQMVLSMGVGLWLTPFLLKRLGPHDFGLWSTAMPILLAVGLLDFGVVAILQRDVAFALGEADGDVRAATALPRLAGRTLGLVLLQLPLLLMAA